MFGELHPVGWSGMFPNGGTGVVVGGRVLHSKCSVCVCTVRVYGLLLSVYGLQQCLCCVEAESTRVPVDTNSGEALRGAFDAACEHIDDAVACNHMV